MSIDNSTPPNDLSNLSNSPAAPTAIVFADEQDAKPHTCIKVMGVGGGGGNAINYMIEHNVQGVDFISANTDLQALEKSLALQHIKLGAGGLGAGGKPDRGRAEAEASVDDIRAAVAGANLLFITAGMGGGTGTGAAPVIARVAKEMGILTVGVVTKPFDFEGGKRMKNAEEGLLELEANVHSMIVVLNDKLLEEYGDDVTQEEAFGYANDVLKNAVGGIAEIINATGDVNVDFEDVRTVMGEQGKAQMGSARASGPDRARIAAEQAIACPLLEDVDLSGARGLLVLVSAARASLKLSETKLAMNTIRAYAAPDAHIIFGTVYDEMLGNEMRITVIATGLARGGNVRRHTPPALSVLRTGTDDAVGYHGNNGYMGGLSNSGLQAGSGGQVGSSVGNGIGNGIGHGLGTGMGGALAPAGFAPGHTPNLAPSQAASGAMGQSAISAATTATAPNYGALSTPSVWRTAQGRTTAAESVDKLSRGGMEEFEIPAFLRKQAD